MRLTVNKIPPGDVSTQWRRLPCVVLGFAVTLMC